MSGGITRAEHRSATRSASACGTNESVPNGRCGPCCSIDPTGRITGVSATIASRTSGHVISSNCTRDSRLATLHLERPSYHAISGERSDPVGDVAPGVNRSAQERTPRGVKY